MTYTYAWANPENTVLHRSDDAFVPAEPTNSDYVEFLNSGATASEYVAPPAPPEPTAAEKLAAAGLTVEELKSLLDL
jgi:hypothetical protein